MPMVRVDVESDLWLPDWVLRVKGQERIKMLRAKQGIREDTTVSQLRQMRSNEKVQGAVVIKKKDDFLVIPALGGMTRDEVLHLIGCYTEGGYGKGPEHKSQSLDWPKAVKNTVDYLVETRKDAKVGRIWR